MLLFSNNRDNYQTFLTRCLTFLKENFDRASPEILGELSEFSNRIENMDSFESRYRLDLLKFRFSRNIFGEDPLGGDDECACQYESARGSISEFAQALGGVSEYLQNITAFKFDYLFAEPTQEALSPIRSFRDVLLRLKNLKRVEITFAFELSFTTTLQAGFFDMQAVAFQIKFRQFHSKEFAQRFFSMFTSDLNIERMQFPSQFFDAFISSSLFSELGHYKHLKVRFKV